jgi:hypothetical protein
MRAVARDDSVVIPMLSSLKRVLGKMKTKLTTIICKVHLRGIFSAAPVLATRAILVGCQTPTNMTTRILPPSTQLSAQQYYQQAPSTATNVDLGVPTSDEVQGADSWSPRVRRPIQIASEPDGRQVSFEQPLDTSLPTQDSDVIRLSIGDRESAASESNEPVVVERPR